MMVPAVATLNLRGNYKKYHAVPPQVTVNLTGQTGVTIAFALKLLIKPRKRNAIQHVADFTYMIQPKVIAMVA